VYIADTDELFFASSTAMPLSMSDIDHNNGIYKLSLAEAERMLKSGGNQTVNVPITKVMSSSMPNLDQG
jgi:gluconolactonase